MRTLVVYATRSGCTAGVAERVAEILARSGMEVDLKPVEEAGDPVSYDAVVVGSGVRVGSWHEPARRWVAEHAETLRARPVAFYTCCLTLATEPQKADEVRAYTEGLIEQTGLEPVDIGLFAGWNEPSRFSFIERAVLGMLRAPRGDFRDFEAIEAWSAGVAPKLGAT